MQGILILQCDKKLEKGEQKIHLYTDLVTGTYMLKLNIENVINTVKLIKL
jgi:hypothetical protein